MGIDQAVDDVIISAEVGVAKPSRDMFELALGRLDVAPSEAVLVDDATVNISAARALGMNAVLHVSTSDTISRLSELGVPGV